MKALLIFGIFCIAAMFALGAFIAPSTDDIPVEPRTLLAVGATKVIPWETGLSSLNGYYVARSLSAEVREDSPGKGAIKIEAVEKKPWPEQFTVHSATVKGIPIADGHRQVSVEISVSVADDPQIVGEELTLVGQGKVGFPVASAVEGRFTDEKKFEEKEEDFSFFLPVTIVATEAESAVETGGVELPWYVRVSETLWWVGLGSTAFSSFHLIKRRFE